MEFELTKELIKLIDDSTLMQFEMNLNGTSLKLNKSESERNPINTLKSREHSMIKINNAIEEIALEQQNSESYITSPVVGIYHSSQKDRKEPFVKLGDKVKRGDLVCIIEILNMIYQIKSDVDGQVVEILVSNECMVQYGQRLF